MIGVLSKQIAPKSCHFGLVEVDVAEEATILKSMISN